MSAQSLQSLLRFLSQDAKVPLATAMGKVKELQSQNLDSPEKLAKAKPGDLKPIFDDEKIVKQIVSAAKRVAKKRSAGDDAEPSPKKKRKESLFAEDLTSPEDLEASVALPTSLADEAELAETVVFTNRAPLVLAFAVILLKHTMPEQPLSSRLSLAQAYVSTTARTRAVNLGIESGLSAEEEGFGEGQPFVTVMGKHLTVLRRWGYEWQTSNSADVQDAVEAEPSGQVQELSVVKNENADDANVEAQEKPALWALDLEALKKSNTTQTTVPSSHAGAHSNLPIYTPQSARAYLLKSFDAPPADASSKKLSASTRIATKELNLGKLLRALDLLYDSWAGTLQPIDLDKRTWGWYVHVRPEVENGVAGWGGKNVVKLADILALRRPAD